MDIQRNSVKSGEGCRKGAQRQALQGRRRPQVETLPPVICWRKCFYAVAINVYCNACELVPGLQRRRRLSQSVVLLAAPSLSPMSLFPLPFAASAMGPASISRPPLANPTTTLQTPSGTARQRKRHAGAGGGAQVAPHFGTSWGATRPLRGARGAPPPPPSEVGHVPLDVRNG